MVRFDKLPPGAVILNGYEVVAPTGGQPNMVVPVRAKYGNRRTSAVPREDKADVFMALWERLATDAPKPEREYRFDAKRKWRFDLAWTDGWLYKNGGVAVEVDGSVYAQGRHTRGAGYEQDCEKLNRATELGWRVFRFTTGMLENDPVACIRQVERALK